MEQKFKQLAVVISAAVVIFGLALLNVLLPDGSFSVSERRGLYQMPELSLKSLSNGSFAAGFEDYALDQFPFRDAFRSAKAYYSNYVLQQKDNNGLYLSQGYLAKMEYPYNEEELTHAAEIFAGLNGSLQEAGCSVYLSVIPDKNAFLAEDSGHLALDYEAMVEQLRQTLPEMEYIDIFPLLSAEDYYYSDTHWKQECITDVAQLLAQSMGTELQQDYRLHTAQQPFRGVYVGQLPLKAKEDRISWLDSEILQGCKVYDHQNDRRIPMYDMELLEGKDPYEMYLGGSLSLITIENPAATTDRELLIFRDSFGSSIAPLLVEGYSKITLVDLRQLMSIAVENYVDFHGQDVLFLYSTLVLNNGSTIK